MTALGQGVFLEDLVGTFRRSFLDGPLVRPASAAIKASDPFGFDVAVIRNCDGLTLAFDEWHECFDDRAAALMLVEAALSGDARLKVDVFAGRRWRWTLERRDGAGDWHAESTVSHPSWRLWGRASVLYLQNGHPRRGDVRAN